MVGSLARTGGDSNAVMVHSGLDTPISAPRRTHPCLHPSTAGPPGPSPRELAAQPARPRRSAHSLTRADRLVDSSCTTRRDPRRVERSSIPGVRHRPRRLRRSVRPRFSWRPIVRRTLSICSRSLPSSADASLGLFAGEDPPLELRAAFQHLEVKRTILVALGPRLIEFDLRLVQVGFEADACVVLHCLFIAICACQSRAISRLLAPRRFHPPSREPGWRQEP